MKISRLKLQPFRNN